MKRRGFFTALAAMVLAPWKAISDPASTLGFPGNYITAIRFPDFVIPYQVQGGWWEIPLAFWQRELTDAEVKILLCDPFASITHYVDHGDTALFVRCQCLDCLKAYSRAMGEAWRFDEACVLGEGFGDFSKHLGIFYEKQSGVHY